MATPDIGSAIIVIRNVLWNWIHRYFKKNPGNAFIVAFEFLLIGVATELWEGNNQVANELGVVGFFLACAGVGLQTLVSIRTRPPNQTINPTSGSNTRCSILDDREDSC